MTEYIIQFSASTEVQVALDVAVQVHNQLQQIKGIVDDFEATDGGIIS